MSWLAYPAIVSARVACDSDVTTMRERWNSPVGQVVGIESRTGTTDTWERPSGLIAPLAAVVAYKSLEVSNLHGLLFTVPQIHENA
jgi:hypothetical protein